ncbi:hypothetical protein [Amycolatopsis sp. H20-H5]|uniref:hypothetical protein n=1 Tax=Amycolatopsis sp. H20-H5 TaxID=3046309 RepID=UPI002DBD5D67|nr:hypothetical protein [Amycolatopsis sp. H20-H5]MEC3982078.1 hypothetical protein [Amycolatopsis sp. H20-H5]
MSGLRRALTLAGLATVALLALAPGAQAQSGLPSSADVSAAKAAAADPGLRAEIGRFFAQGGGKLRAAAGQAPAVSVGDQSIPVYELSRDFVVGTRGASAGLLAYIAVPVSASDGQTATLWTVRGGDGRWQVGNIASGDREYKLSQALPAGAMLLHEPQVDAWYAVKDGLVTPLDVGASGLKAGQAVPLARYQKTVGGRYGDKLAGSPYDRKGTAGGFAAEVMPRGDGAPAPETQEAGWIPLLALCGGLLVIGVVGFVLHARRQPA